MGEVLSNVLYLLSRYFHVVATTILVGGTIFYEMVVPVAIGELKTEQQLAVFARMRWVFRWLVYIGAILLIATGGISTYRNRTALSGDYERYLARHSSEQAIQSLKQSSIFNRPFPWFVAHLVVGVLSVLIAVMLVSGGRPPDKPLQWMRINLVLLLVAIFVASASRNARMRLFEGARADEAPTLPRD